MLSVRLGNLLESTLLLMANLFRVALLSSNHRFLHVSPPFLTKQYVIDIQKKRLISYRIQSWSDWRTGFQIFGADSYNLESLGLEKRIKDIYLRDLEESKPVILDLGGNIGLSSLYFSMNFPEAKIYCVEIDESNVILARKNLAKFPNVSVIHAGAASKPGRGYVVDPGLGNDSLRLTLKPEGSFANVDLIDVASLLRKQEQDHAFIVKIDVEGSEGELFSANTDWVDDTSLIIMEPHDWLFPRGANSKYFLESIAGKNRDFLIRGENVFSIANKGQK